MTLRPRATEVPELVRRLGSRKPRQVDRARARLSIIGSHSVAALVEALEGDNNRVRTHAMPLLALIQDPRGREPLVAMLLDRDPRMREIAARCLARFSSLDAVAALERLLKREKVRDVRISTVHGLIELYEAGQDSAIRRIVEVMLDAKEDPGSGWPAMALAPAGSVLPPYAGFCVAFVKTTSRRSLGERPRSRRGRRSGTSGPIPVSTPLVAAGGPRTTLIWKRGAPSLYRCGGRPLRKRSLRRCGREASDPEYCTRAGMALKALGPRRSDVSPTLLDASGRAAAAPSVGRGCGDHRRRSRSSID
jgi:hypothetical protein